MSAEHLAAVDIDPEQARMVVDFMEDYASLCFSELDQQPIAADRPASGPVPLPGDDQRWTIWADAASSLREAGQWALSFDSARARQLLVRSGALFFRLGYPFGAYLEAISGGWLQEAPVAELRRSLDDVAYLNGLLDNPRDAPIPTPLYHPQQQAYLVLACADQQRTHRQLREPLRAIVTNSAHRDGVVSVGALGIPIRRYWEVAEALIDDLELHSASHRESRAAGPALLAAHVVAMANRYADSAELARTNSHVWRHAAAPVDIADIDVVGITAMAARRFGASEMRSILENRLSDVRPLARMQVEIALDFAESEPSSDVERRSDQ